ncbi:Por secretion system C-terminal sorting domain-containing protein [Catalinimonas alkaloidigena]|uniref:Por secretion system C-terminal sorting domain-containing protein n=1 Tax=Catalinimonas alkaloidigena TaxID=1075417 RepID=A0A1G9ALX3_9BACT|nr:T9SS type A sorting domain-containing protein [Catalinimonas alkaloidigena]SDK28243.1 Por secretion system C-terminal sorting domain-containing protein [Catalinimonas alkaloidigena]
MTPLRILFLLFGFFTVALPLQAQTYRWRNVVMGGGGFVPGIVFSPTEPGLVYARTDVGGAYRWDAAGRTWISITDHLSRNESNYTGVRSLALDPSDPDRVYLATGLYSQSWAGTGAILASTDRGTTWSHYPLSIKLGGNEDGRSTGECLQVDPSLNSRLLLGSSTDGLWKSEDYGASWAQVTSFPINSTPAGRNGISFVLFDTTGSTAGQATPTIYVGVLRTGASNLYQSLDGGVTWSAVPGQTTTLMPHQAVVDDQGNIYITYSNGPGPNNITSGDVRRYQAATNQWTSIRPDQGQQGGFAGISRHPNGTLLVSTIDRWWPGDEVFRSTDNGATWQPLVRNATWDYAGFAHAAESTPHWLGDVDINPFDADQAWFVTGYGVFHATNLTTTSGAVTWSFDNAGLEETVPLGLISPPSGPHLVVALGDIDGFRYETQLETSPAEGRLSPQYGTNTSIAFAEQQPAVMARTHYNANAHYGSYSTDGGASWQAFASAPLGTSGGGTIALSADGNTLVWSPAGAGFHYSTNRGSTWLPASGAASGMKPVADRVNGQKFYVYHALQGQVWRSTDGGKTFTQGATGLPSLYDWQLNDGALQAVFGQEDHLWLNHPSGLYRSTDGGQTFSPVTGVASAYALGFGKAAPGSDYPAIFMAGVVAGVYGFYRSDDQGTQWTRINDDAHQFGWVGLLAGDPRVYGRVYLGTGGRGVVYGEPAEATTSSERMRSHPVHLYPNPSADGSFSLRTDARSPIQRVQVLDLQGRLLWEHMLPALTSEAMIRTTLWSGFYLVRCFSSQGVSTQKLIVR